MSRVVISRKRNLMFYIDDYEIGSSGYMIDYTKGDNSNELSCQCKIKIVDYMVFGTISNSKKYFIELHRKYPEDVYKQFVVQYSNFMIVYCVQQVSDWEVDLLNQNEIRGLILFGDKNALNNKPKDGMITFNTEWMERRDF